MKIGLAAAGDANDKIAAKGDLAKKASRIYVRRCSSVRTGGKANY